MDPLEKLYLYYSWVDEVETDLKTKRQLGILIGSFTNPKEANAMAKKDDPDVVSTDEDFEQSWQMVEDFYKNNDVEIKSIDERAAEESKKHRRNRRKKVIS